MVHLRSPEARRKRRLLRQKEREEREVMNGIVLNYSYSDPLNGEKVFSTIPCAHDKDGNPISFADIVVAKITAKFGYTQSCVLNHESGEVLNRGSGSYQQIRGKTP